ncbi:MAG: diguanylate cyclase [Deltaproteobacteria bacterium]|nr:diguanylate cyclase [Deltaproteobacteria bacterium]
MTTPDDIEELGAETAPLAGRQALNSISTRIIFFVFLSTFVTALVVSWISIDTIHRTLRSHVEARFPVVLERRAEELNEQLAATRQALGIRAAEAGVEHLLGGRGSSQRLNDTALSLLDVSPSLRGLVVIDAGGQERARVGQVSDAIVESLTADIEGQSAFGSGHDEQNMPWAALVLPIGDTAEAGSPPGARLAAVLRATSFVDLLLVLPSDQAPGRLVMTDVRGRIVLTADGIPDAEQAVALPVVRMLREGASKVIEYGDPDGGHMLGSIRPLEQIDWLIVVEAPFAEVSAPVLSAVKRIFLIDLAIILIFSFLAFKITSAIMQPIEALSEGAARISQGDISHEIPPPRSNDEIGLLTRTFNQMMVMLRRSQQEIELDRLRLTEQNEELQRANEVLAQLSITDGLTKLHNHRYFQDHLTREIKRLSRTGEPLSMILIDLDDFKRLNDSHGHSAGDEVLMSIASEMNDSVRESDLLARYGGEEFVILAPNTALDGAVALAEKIRMSIETKSRIIDDSMRPVRVTISCGVAQYQGDRKRFFQAADRVLYRAKAQGKNCVIAANNES